MVSNQVMIAIFVTAILVAPFSFHESLSPPPAEADLTAEQLVYPVYDWRRTSSGWEKVRLPAPGEDFIASSDAEFVSTPQFIAVDQQNVPTNASSGGTRHLNPILATIAIALLSRLTLKSD